MPRLIKFISSSLLAYMGVLTLQAQSLGNEWINFSQSYYTFKVAQNGIYRITFDAMSEAGIPLSTVPKQKFRVYRRGEEVALNIFDANNNAVIESGDYIELYAEKNDGVGDTELYVTTEAQPHTYYNIFTDTATYFLTWNVTGDNGLRMNSFNEANTDNIAADTYFLEEKIVLKNSFYAEGKTYDGEGLVNRAEYDYGEGWTSGQIARNGTSDFTITGFANRTSVSELPQIELRLYGMKDVNHTVTLSVGANTGSLRVINTVNFDGFTGLTTLVTPEATDFSTDGQIVVRITNANTVSDFLVACYAKASIPVTYNWDDATDRLVVTADHTDKYYVSWSGAPTQTQIWKINDTKRPVKISSRTVNGNVTAVFPAPTSTLKDRLYFSTTFQSVVLEKVTFSALSYNFNYAIITDPILENAATEWETYRESTAGGQHQVEIFYYDDICLQFNYGDPSPLAIRRFVQSWHEQGHPEYLFIIGKGLTPDLNSHRTTLAVPDYVPSFGHPGSENGYSSGLAGFPESVESVPTGRINALTDQDAVAYLEKVKTMEALPFDALWRKELLNLSGGRTTSELKRFKSYVTDFKNVAESFYLGGHASIASKETSDAVEYIDITQNVNDGLLLVTLFGHSAAASADIEIGLASDPRFGYNNQDKYPFIFVNGCNAGQFYTTSPPFGQDWINTPNLGAIGFIANSDFSLEGNLRRYGDVFFEVAFADSAYIGKPFGLIKQEIGMRYLENFGESGLSYGQVATSIYQGDPALRLFNTEKPDFAITESQIEISAGDDAQLLATTSILQVSFSPINYGIAIADSLIAGVSLISPNGKVIIQENYPFAPLLLADTFALELDKSAVTTSGNYQLTLTLDPMSEFAEINENNNSVTINVFLPSSATVNLLPTNYAFASGNNVTFAVQSSDVLIGTKEYVMEISKDPSFTVGETRSVSFAGNGIAKTTFNITSLSLSDSAVVYWRSRFLNPENNEDTAWTYSSFTWLETQASGWSQRSAVQLSENDVIGLTLSDDEWTFEENEAIIEIQCIGDNAGTYDDIKIIQAENDLLATTAVNDPTCRDNAVMMIAFQENSLQPYKPVTFGSLGDVSNVLVCGRFPQIVYNFTPTDQSTLQSFITNVAEGDYILVMTIGNPNWLNFSDETMAFFTQMGVKSATIASLGNNQPVIWLGKKGMLEGEAIEIASAELPFENQILTLNTLLSGAFTSGSMVSQAIGPALSWGSVTLELTDDATDQYALQLWALDSAKNQKNVVLEQPSGTVSLTIDAKQNPFLQWELTIDEDDNNLPPQVNHWHVTFDEFPESILLLNTPSSTAKVVDDVIEGQSVTLDLQLINITSIPFTDSLEVKTQIFNQQLLKTIDITEKSPPLGANDTINFSILLPTLDFVGTSNVTITALPTGGYDRHSFNNTLFLENYYTVTADETNPIFNVFFDGIQITNGEIVSPSPIIDIEAQDNNPYFQKSDTTGLIIKHKKPCAGCDYETLYFSDSELQFTPSDENGKFSISYTPEKLSDGVHFLSVNVADASGNAAAAVNYEISFEVINESSITHFYPYPNPFSTSTRFVFTLTGSEIPQQIKIQIMTVTGKIVKEINQSEIGSLRIGNNITAYAWDGSDEYGDKLANGVYFYRVLINGMEIKHRSTSADKAFKQGFGKIYILR